MFLNDSERTHGESLSARYASRQLRREFALTASQLFGVLDALKDARASMHLSDAEKHFGLFKGSDGFRFV